jgi:hypothetical protein
MINKFKQTLRMAALEDLLHHDLGLRPSMAAWMTRMTWDIAGECDVDLMAYRGKALLSQAIELISSSNHRGILQSAAEQSEAFAAFLGQSFNQPRHEIKLQAAA